MPSISNPRRLTWLLIIGGGLISVLLIYRSYFLARPIGEGPAGPAVAKEHFQRPWTERKVMLLGLGDSITAGLGADTPSHSFFNRLARNPKDEFAELQGCCLSAVLPNLETQNNAVSGTTSLNHWDALGLKLGEPAADDVFGLVVMTSGGNDIIHNYGRTAAKEGAMYGATLAEAEPWIKNYEARLEQIFLKINHHFPGGCEIFIGDIYDPTDGVGNAPSVYLPHWPDGLAIHAAYNEVLRKAAARHPFVHVVPLHATFMGHGSHCRQFWRTTYRRDDPHYWFYVNIEDPNDRGYDAIRRVFLNEIVRFSKLSPDSEKSAKD